MRLLKLKRKIVLVLALLCCCATSLSAQLILEECSTPSLPITDNNTTADTITFTDVRTIESIEVAIDLSHTYQGDLWIDLSSPSGTTVRLFDQNGGGSNDLVVTYTDSGIAHGSPYNCNCDMQPFSPLSALDGEDTAGDWLLEVRDNLGGDNGNLNEWCLTIDPGEAIFRRGDVDSDGDLQINDVVMLLRHLFVPAAVVPLCPDAEDLDDNGTLDLQDAVRLLNYMYLPGSQSPASPGALTCGIDPSTDSLPDCVETNSCD